MSNYMAFFSVHYFLSDGSFMILFDVEGINLVDVVFWTIKEIEGNMKWSIVFD